MVPNGWGMDIFGMAGYPWCDAAVQGTGDRKVCKKSTWFIFLRGSNYDGRVSTETLLLRPNCPVRKKSTFHGKGELYRKMGILA
jgi:hypothetical protein